MSFTKLSENALIFAAPKRLYTMALPSEITEDFIMEEFGRKANINLQYNGKPVRIHEGKITYYQADGGFARALMKDLAEEAKKKEKKTKVEFDPELCDIQAEEKETDK